jgi:glutathione S-transferase
MTTNESSTHELVGAHFSPWSMRARWALDYHEIQYQFTKYTPMVDEAWLRFKSGRYFSQISVPMLFISGPKKQVLCDSYDIVQYADGIGNTMGHTKLVPDELKVEIEQWSEKINELLAPLRIISMKKALTDEDVKQEELPGWAKSMGSAGDYIYRSACNYIVKKYPVTNDQQDDQTIRKYLDEIQQRIQSVNNDDKSSVAYLFGNQFTYGDIVTACALQLLNPVDDSVWRLKPGQRKVVTHPIHSEYPLICTWRDQIFAKHFKTPNVAIESV